MERIKYWEDLPLYVKNSKNTTLDCEHSLRMVTRARKSREASESKIQEAKGKLGRRRLSLVSLSAILLSQVLPSLDSTDWRGLLAV